MADLIGKDERLEAVVHGAVLIVLFLFLWFTDTGDAAVVTKQAPEQKAVMAYYRADIEQVVPEEDVRCAADFVDGRPDTSTLACTGKFKMVFRAGSGTVEVTRK